MTVGTETTSYSYWPSGLRLSKSTEDTTNTFIWNGANLTYESGSGTKYICGKSLIASLESVIAGVGITIIMFGLSNSRYDVISLS